MELKSSIQVLARGIHEEVDDANSWRFEYPAISGGNLLHRCNHFVALAALADAAVEHLLVLLLFVLRPQFSAHRPLGLPGMEANTGR
jgi:hypothetical protein